MLVLLPPSEGKTAPAQGAPVDLSALSEPSLTAQRRRVLSALVRLCRQPDASSLLGAGPGRADEVLRNRRLRREPAAPAREVYTGTLYAAADLADLSAQALARAERSVRTVSALWGLVTPSDRIPAYRLSMGTDLPGVGRLAGAWRAPLGRVLDPVAAQRLVVDCRSSAYLAAWAVPVGGPGSVVVRVEREVAGRRRVVSHWAKQTRGRLARHLLTRNGPEPTTPQELLEAAHEMVGPGLLAVELEPADAGRHVLTLVVP